MARISLEPRRDWFVRLGEWYSRRKYGAVLDPGKALAHNRRVLLGIMRFESRVARWKTADAGLQHLAVMAAACRIGCSWCVDFGYWVADDLGLPLDKVARVAAWREHADDFTELERMVMEYAEAMSDTPLTVTDEMTHRLVERLGEAAVVELTALVALENQRSRINSAFGLTGQGFSERCAVPSTRRRG